MSASLRFERSARLLQPQDFQRVFKRARRVQDAYFRVFGRPNETDRARLGLAISKKVDKRAVGRNRLKRQIRESFRHNQEVLSGLDIIVMAKAPAVAQSNEQLRKALDQLWRKLRDT